jgi:hypothetical protein
MGYALSPLTKNSSHFSNNQEKYFANDKPNENSVSIVVCPLTIVRPFLFTLYNIRNFYVSVIASATIYFINNFINNNKESIYCRSRPLIFACIKYFVNDVSPISNVVNHTAGM